ncbi:hypothetical protein M409DRAFT_67610 [Zasmidium cellare ATCC 36951]|uniref:Postreplication repair E3 ubiquitin-protein ligase RAD18 n=1 Tax=Zasmidium cellare ATCC 36951 TaxID=1080233 RepID=A0A6A6CHL4_ZASCE|nr:uncharacterized protein M409DRAFT_67610 [Zasmidium cellare ATCC 36951]KAF2164906.1 hypothetical protein M409DRAFT_67610 [Zasmidium cellare ATCC 36951]
MDSAYDVPDSTDWLSTPLNGFSELENALHCQICKEFYDTPMITSCNHTFCSKCIRTSLSADGKCPACRTSDQANKLRNNWALQEVVTTFVTARPAALGVARQAQDDLEAPKRVGKRKRPAVLDSDDISEAEASGRTTRSKSRRIAASQESQPEPIEIADSNDEDEEYMPEPPPDDGRVECPLGCGKRMKEVDVFTHLDRCEDEKKQASRSKARTPLNGFGRSASGHNARPQDRINELNYSMMKELALKKKLKDVGIPDWGTKQLLIQRHREWVNIWNANCDSNHPRSKRDLLYDLDVWERTQGGRAPNPNGLSSTIMKKDFDGDAYSKRHQDEFSRLIADAKRKKSNPATETKSPKDEEDTTQQPTEDGSADSTNPAANEQVKPYENNPEALSSIREKVEALNRGESIEPVLNEGFKAPSTEAVPIPTGPSNAHDFALPQSTQPAAKPPSTSNATSQSSNTNGDHSNVLRIAQPVKGASPEKHAASLGRPSSRDEHSTHRHTGSPCDLATHITDASNPPRKVPMFAVPAQPVGDIDGGVAGS